MREKDLTPDTIYPAAATVWMVTTPMEWGGGGETLSIHWTQEGAYLEVCRRQALDRRDPNFAKELNIEPMDIVD
jgi:hypothetical protein